MIENARFGRPARVWVGALAGIGWAALGLQLATVVSAALGKGTPWDRPLADTLSFFTVQTDAIVSAVLTVAATRGRFGHPSLAGATVVYAVVVGVIYAALLRNVYHPAGWQQVTNVVFHDLMPVLYPLTWLALAPKGALSGFDPLRWLCYPLAFVVYTTLRGAALGWYPYPFVDVIALGYPIVARNTVAILAAFVVTGFVVVGVDRIARARAS